MFYCKNKSTEQGLGQLSYNVGSNALKETNGRNPIVRILNPNPLNRIELEWNVSR